IVGVHRRSLGNRAASVRVLSAGNGDCRPVLSRSVLVGGRGPADARQGRVPPNRAGSCTAGGGTVGRTHTTINFICRDSLEGFFNYNSNRDAQQVMVSGDDLERSRRAPSITALLGIIPVEISSSIYPDAQIGTYPRISKFDSDCVLDCLVYLYRPAASDPLRGPSVERTGLPRRPSASPRDAFDEDRAVLRLTQLWPGSPREERHAAGGGERLVRLAAPSAGGRDDSTSAADCGSWEHTPYTPI
ncbi:hypothetical protein THAOC_03265, partial [Thalassiosira oceanica]